MNQTWPFKDIDSRPSQGRFFPISFAQAARAANRWQMNDADGKRVRICFLNDDDDDAATLLIAEFRPKQALMIYSWPERHVAELARKAVAKAFPVLAPLKLIPAPGGRANFSGCYLIRWQSDAQVRLTQCKIHFQHGKFGGGQSFASAFKRKVTRIEEKDLPIPNDIEPDGEILSKGSALVA